MALLLSRLTTDVNDFPKGAECPLCCYLLSEHDWVEVKHVTETSGEPVACSRMKCQWFAKCDNPATHAERHPVLGFVAACDRCVKIGR